MKAILQRVKFAKVEVGGETVGEIGQGFLVLLGVAKEDDKGGRQKGGGGSLKQNRGTSRFYR